MTSYFYQYQKIDESLVFQKIAKNATQLINYSGNSENLLNESNLGKSRKQNGMTSQLYQYHNYHVSLVFQKISKHATQLLDFSGNSQKLPNASNLEKNRKQICMTSQFYQYQKHHESLVLQKISKNAKQLLNFSGNSEKLLNESNFEKIGNKVA